MMPLLFFVDNICILVNEITMIVAVFVFNVLIWSNKRLAVLIQYIHPSQLFLELYRFKNYKSLRTTIPALCLIGEGE